jgi:hypothetical protein
LPAVPVVDSVPLMVWRELKVTSVTPAVERAVMVKLLNVLIATIEFVPEVVLVNATL